MSERTYMQRRIELELLMEDAARIIREETEREARAQLVARCTDSLMAEVEQETGDGRLFADPFVQSADRFLHSVKVPPLLSVIKGGAK